MAAFATQRLHGNKSFMKKLITTDPSTAEKLIGKIREMRENFKVRKDPAAKAQLEMVRKAEKLFMQGLSEAGGTIDSKGKIHLANREEDEELTRENSEKMHVSYENGTENAVEDASGENKKSPAEGEVRYSLGKDSGKNNYSYSALNAKADIQIVTLSSDMPRKKDGKIDRGAVIDAARKNARAQNNPNNNEKETYVYVPDLGLDVRVSRDGIEHGLKRNPEDTAIATMNIGDLLKNSVAVNELEGRTTSKKETEMSFVLLAAGKNKNGDYLARIVVDKNSKAISEISAYGLYAVNAKKEGALFMPKGNEGVEENSSVPYLRSTISIADLIENVKRLNLANEVFSADVAQKLGVERAKGSLSNDLRFSRKATGDTVTISKGELAKLHANYAGEKVFDKKSVKDALASVEAFQKLPSKLRTEFVNRIWAGYNQRLHQQGFEQFTEVMWHQLHAEVLCYG